MVTATKLDLAENRFEALGLSISAQSFDQTLSMLLEAPQRGERLRVHFCALHTLVEAARDDTLRDSLNQGGLLLPDGTPLKWLARTRHQRIERVCGPDMMRAVLEHSPSRGLRHFFYGSTTEILEDLVASVERECPGIEISGTCSPVFRPLTDTEIQATAETINAARPDFVWVALGSPKQDRWLARFRPLLDAPVILGVGAAFDFISGRAKRAPLWARDAGIEWLFRLQAEPRRLAGRYTMSGLFLGYLLMLDLARRRPGRSQLAAKLRDVRSHRARLAAGAHQRGGNT